MEDKVTKIDGNELNLLSDIEMSTLNLLFNIGRYTLVTLQTSLDNLEVNLKRSLFLLMSNVFTKRTFIT